MICARPLAEAECEMPRIVSWHEIGEALIMCIYIVNAKLYLLKLVIVPNTYALTTGKNIMLLKLKFMFSFFFFAFFSFFSHPLHFAWHFTNISKSKIRKSVPPFPIFCVILNHIIIYILEMIQFNFYLFQDFKNISLSNQ